MLLSLLEPLRGAKRWLSSLRQRALTPPPGRRLQNLGRWGLAKVGGVRCVGGQIIEHRVDGRSNWFEFGEA